MHKIWHKPLHKRKAWKTMTLAQKTLYYMRPFVEHFLDVWLQPLPFPTILKFAYSSVLIVFIMFPLIYPVTILMVYWAVVQYLLESGLDIQYRENLDVLNYIDKIMSNIPSKEYELLIQTYMEQCRYMAAVCASFIDYMRLATSMVFA